jgi:hypothetical protein
MQSAVLFQQLCAKHLEQLMNVAIQIVRISQNAKQDAAMQTAILFQDVKPEHLSRAQQQTTAQERRPVPEARGELAPKQTQPVPSCVQRMI